MIDITNRFKRRLAEGAPPLGSWLMAASPATAEAMGHVGFDFLVVDMEHVPIDYGELAHILRAIGCTAAAPVVRLPGNDPVTIKRALDAGAETIMVPFVESVAEARAAVAAAQYPPRGMRGVAAVHRASRYGRAPDYFARADAETGVILQLETPGAVALLPEIAALPGVDAVFVGPGDLSAAMGHLGNIAHPDVQAALEAAARAATAAGTPIGIVGPNPEMVGRFLAWGYSFAAVASDLAMMTGRAADWLGTLKGAATTPAPGKTAAY